MNITGEPTDWGDVYQIQVDRISVRERNNEAIEAAMKEAKP